MKKIIPLLLSVLVLLSVVSCSNKAEEVVKNYTDLTTTFNETKTVSGALSSYLPLILSSDGTVTFSADTSSTFVGSLYNSLSSESVNVTCVESGEGTIRRTVTKVNSDTVKTEYVMTNVSVAFKYTTGDDKKSAKDGVLSLNGTITINNETGEVSTTSLTVLGVGYRDMYLKGNLTKGEYVKASIGGTDVDVRLVNNKIGSFPY